MQGINLKEYVVDINDVVTYEDLVTVVKEEFIVSPFVLLVEFPEFDAFVFPSLLFVDDVLFDCELFSVLSPINGLLSFEFVVSLSFVIGSE